MHVTVYLVAIKHHFNLFYICQIKKKQHKLLMLVAFKVYISDIFREQ